MGKENVKIIQFFFFIVWIEILKIRGDIPTPNGPEKITDCILHSLYSDVYGTD